jgi:DNA polymerase-3 subunit epsilon
MYSADWIAQNRREVTAWANDLFEQGFLILDTETTGIRSGYHEIIQIGVINSAGDVLLNTLVKPQYPERLTEWSVGGKRAIDIHGIMPHMLTDAPAFPDVHEQLCEVVKRQHLVIYNAGFDRKMIEGDCRRHQLRKISVKKYHCAMLQYAQWHGAVNRMTGGFRWQSLETACNQLHIFSHEQAHSALGDCRRTLEVMRRLASI